MMAEVLVDAVAIRSAGCATGRPASVADSADSAACHCAVNGAITLRRLRSQYRETGFLALPLDQYLSRLARLANVALPTISMNGGERSSRLDPWLALARKIEFNAAHLSLWVRAWFAVEFQPPPSVFVAARDRRGAPLPQPPGSLAESASPEEASAALGRYETRYSPAERRQLDAVLEFLD